MWEVKKFNSKSGYLFPNNLEVLKDERITEFGVYKAIYRDRMELVLNDGDYWFIVSMTGSSVLALKKFNDELRRVQDEKRRARQ